MSELRKGYLEELRASEPNTVLGYQDNELLTDIIARLASNFAGPCRMHASTPADALLTIEATNSVAGDGTGRSAPPVAGQVPSIPKTTINFQTGQVTGGPVTYNGTSFAVMPSSTIGKFRRFAFAVQVDGTIGLNYGDEATTRASLENPGTLLAGLTGLPLGYVDLEGSVTASAGKFKTAGSTGAVVENNPQGTPAIYLFGIGGSEGSSTLSAEPPSKPYDGYTAIVWDAFDVSKTATDTKVASITNAKYLPAKRMYKMSCDKTKTVTTTGTSYVLSTNPSYTVEAGDVIYCGGEFRRIASVTTQASGVLDAAFTANKSAASCMVSQAVWTVDLVGFGTAAEGNRLRDFYPLKPVERITSLYFDSVSADDTVPDFNTAPKVVMSASNYGLQSETAYPTCDSFAAVFTRPAATAQLTDYNLLAPANRQRLFLVFFPNPDEATVTTSANLIGYEASLYPVDVLPLSGGFLSSAFCMTDGTGTPYGCTVATISGLTTLTLNWTFIPGTNAGQPDGDIEVIVEGMIIPRWYDGVSGAYWKEVGTSNNQVQLWMNLSGYNYSAHVRRRQGVIDSSSQNNLRLLAAWDGIVGSQADVLSGKATHSSVQAAVAAYPGGKILVLSGTYAEAVTLSTAGQILEGRGSSTVIMQLNVAAAACDISRLKLSSGLALQAGSRDSFVRAWVPTAGTVTTDPTSTGNILQVIRTST